MVCQRCGKTHCDRADHYEAVNAAAAAEGSTVQITVSRCYDTPDEIAAKATREVRPARKLAIPA
jgi:hypothetical protein